MNDKPETKIGYISPLKRICMTIGELPSSYLETMTYYEMLVWFVEFLKNQVIPVVNNNSEATEELQNLFIELQNYVNNYFDNLDVQEEINNKLDEMAEDGTLMQLLTDYLPYISVDMYGAIGDGITDDTTAIQTAINSNYGKEILFTENKTYLISEHIYTSAEHDKKQFLKLGNNTTIKASDEFTDDYMIVLGEVDEIDIYSDSYKITGLEGGIIDCNGVTSGIKIERTHMTEVKNTRIINAHNIGLRINKSNNDSADALIQNIFVRMDLSTNENGVGIHVDSFDNNIMFVRTSRCHTGILITGGGNYFKNCHPLYGVTNEGTSYYESSVAFLIRGDNNQFEQCYNDNFSTSILQDGDYDFFVSSFFSNWYENLNYKHTMIKVSNTTYFKGKITGLFGGFPTNGTNRVLINESGNLGVYNLGNKPATAGYISNLKVDGISNVLNYWTDEAFTSSVLGLRDYTMLNTDAIITRNQWYPFLFVRNTDKVPVELYLNIGDSMSLKIKLNTKANSENDNVVYSVESRTDDLNVTDIEIGRQHYVYNESVDRNLIIYYFKITRNHTSYPTSGMGGYSVSLMGGNLDYAKLVIPIRNFYTNVNMMNKLTEDESHPISTIKNLTNINVFGQRGIARGNGEWKTTHIIDGTNAGMILVYLHFSSYNLIYLLKTYSSNIYKKELLGDPSSLEHEPTITFNNTTKEITITLSESGTMQYFIL